MKKVIDIREFSPPAGQEYLATSYPGPGLYRTSVGWILVYSSGTVSCAIHIGSGFAPPIPMEDYVEAKIEAKVDTSISASDLLRAVAISQNPLLAKELLK